MVVGRMLELSMATAQRPCRTAGRAATLTAAVADAGFPARRMRAGGHVRHVRGAARREGEDSPITSGIFDTSKSRAAFVWHP
jgi:hypothetical protein